MRQYILDEHGNPIYEPNRAKWETWLETAKLHVADEQINGVRVSTIFLPSIAVDEEPLAFWETAVLGGLLDQVKDRCAGQREQAEAMHARMIARVKAQQKLK